MKQNIIIFAPEFRPYPGGVSEYTFQLMKSFYGAGKLDRLITHEYQGSDATNKIDFLKVDWREKRRMSFPVLLRKFLSALYSVVIRLFYLKKIGEICLGSKEKEIIINSLFNRFSWWAIYWFRLFGVKYVLLIHGLDLIEQSKKNSLRLQNALAGAHRLITNSSATKNMLPKFTKQDLGTKVLIYWPPFDQAEFDAVKGNLQTLGIADLSNKKVISTVCRLVERKGLDYAIKALSPLLKSHSEWVYLIAGEGEDRAVLQELIHENNLKEQVILLGSISNEEKNALLRKSEVFMMPNHSLNESDVEGFGISFVEAQYYENAIIGGKSGGVVESVWDERSGFLIPFSSSFVKEIQEKAAHLMVNKTVRIEMQRDAKDFVLRNFEAKQLVARIKNDF